jgi:Na+/melibiose symporter-like transporter
MDGSASRRKIVSEFQSPLARRVTRQRLSSVMSLRPYIIIAGWAVGGFVLWDAIAGCISYGTMYILWKCGWLSGATYVAVELPACLSVFAVPVLLVWLGMRGKLPGTRRLVPNAGRGFDVVRPSDRAAT